MSEKDLPRLLDRLTLVLHTSRIHIADSLIIHPLYGDIDIPAGCVPFITLLTWGCRLQPLVPWAFKSQFPMGGPGISLYG